VKGMLLTVFNCRFLQGHRTGVKEFCPSIYVRLKIRVWKFPVISQTFMVYYGILLRIHSTWMYCVNFWFCLRSFREFTKKFQALSKWFKILKFWTWRWRKLKKSISQIPIWNYFYFTLIFSKDFL
jgi:hypothetical protein